MKKALNCNFFFLGGGGGNGRIESSGLLQDGFLNPEVGKCPFLSVMKIVSCAFKKKKKAGVNLN